jgi:hypothetical protein
VLLLPLLPLLLLLLLQAGPGCTFRCMHNTTQRTPHGAGQCTTRADDSARVGTRQQRRRAVDGSTTWGALQPGADTRHQSALPCGIHCTSALQAHTSEYRITPMTVIP